MRRIQTSNSERQAKSKNLHEQRQLRKHLEKLSLNQISNTNSGRVETQKWRQFLKDCAKNTGSCSTTMRQALKGNHDNMCTPERGYDVLNRQRSRSESQLYVKFQKLKIYSTDSELNCTTDPKFADSAENSKCTVHSERSSEWLKLDNYETGRKIIANLRCKRKTNFKGSITARAQSASLSPRRALYLRTPVTSPSDTELVKYAKLPLRNTIMKSEGPSSSLNSNVALIPESARFVSMSSQHHVQLAGDSKAGIDLQKLKSVNNRLSLPNSTNNFHTVKTQNCCYHKEMNRKALKENVSHPQTDKIQEDLRGISALTSSMTAQSSLSVTVETTDVESQRKSLLSTSAVNCHEKGNPEIVQQNNTKGEITCFNTISQSNLEVVSPCSLQYINKAADFNLGSMKIVEEITPDHNRELSTMEMPYSARHSVERQHITNFQFPRERSMNSKSHRRSIKTVNSNVIANMSDSKYTNVQNLLKISDYVKTPSQTKNKMEVIDLAKDGTWRDRQSKVKTVHDTKIDLCEFRDQFQVTVPAKAGSDDDDSNKVTPRKTPTLSQDQDNPDRITIRQLGRTANRLTNNRCSVDDRKLEGSPRHRAGHSSNDCQIQKYRWNWVSSHLGHLSVKGVVRYNNEENSDKISRLGWGKDEQKDKNVNVLSTRSRQTLNTLSPEKLQGELTTPTAVHRLNPSPTSLTASPNTIFKNKGDDNGRCLPDLHRNPKSYKPELERPIKNSQISKIRSARTSCSTLNTERDHPGPCLEDVVNNVQQFASQRSADVKQCQTSKLLSSQQKLSHSDSTDSKLSYQREPSVVSSKQTAKFPPNLDPLRKSVTLFYGNINFKEPNIMLSDRKLSKEGKIVLSNKKHSNRSVSVLVNRKLSRKSFYGSSKIECSRDSVNVVMTNSAGKSLTEHNSKVTHVLYNRPASESSASILSNMKQIRDSDVSDYTRESNPGWCDNECADSAAGHHTEHGIFNAGESIVGGNETNVSFNNYVNKNKGLKDNNVPVNQTVADRNHNTDQSQQGLSVYHAQNVKLFEDSSSVSILSVPKPTPGTTTSCDVNRQLAPPDPSPLSHVKDATEENCRVSRTQPVFCSTAQHQRHLGGRWKTVGSRVMTGNQLHKPVLTSDVVMSKKCRQRVIARMMEDNFKRPINSQKMLADVALRMRVEQFLRSF